MCPGFYFTSFHSFILWFKHFSSAFAEVQYLYWNQQVLAKLNARLTGLKKPDELYSKLQLFPPCYWFNNSNRSYRAALPVRAQGWQICRKLLPIHSYRASAEATHLVYKQKCLFDLAAESVSPELQASTWLIKFRSKQHSTQYWRQRGHSLALRFCFQSNPEALK